MPKHFSFHPGRLAMAAAAFAVLSVSAPALAGHGGHEGRGFHHGDAYVRELRQLDLTEAQRETIRGFLHAGRDQGKVERERIAALRRGFAAAEPGTRAYDDALVKLADAEAQQARRRVEHRAELRAQIHGVLTPEQRTQLAQAIAERQERAPKREHGPRPDGQPRS